MEVWYEYDEGSLVKGAALHVQTLHPDRTCGLSPHSLQHTHVDVHRVFTCSQIATQGGALDLIDHSLCDIGLSIGVQSGGRLHETRVGESRRTVVWGLKMA